MRCPHLGLPGVFRFFINIQTSENDRIRSSTSRFTKQNSCDLNEQAVAQKLADSEALLESWANLHGIEWIILRPTLIYGYGQDKKCCRNHAFYSSLWFFPHIGQSKRPKATYT